jgi:hypothetical protein
MRQREPGVDDKAAEDERQDLVEAIRLLYVKHIRRRQQQPELSANHHKLRRSNCSWPDRRGDPTRLDWHTDCTCLHGSHHCLSDAKAPASLR